MTKQPDYAQVLDVAAEAGHILLENGAEISRVEDIMSRISAHYGVDTGNFFILSNGIFTTGHPERVSKAGGQASTYANVEFIPIRGIQLSKVVAVNRLSYDIAADKIDLAGARARLKEIRSSAIKPVWERMLGIALGAAGFCGVFIGSWIDIASAFVVGLLLSFFMVFVSGRYLSKIVGGVCNALLSSILCIAFWRIGFGNSLANIIIGAVMPLIPGVPFVNGVRDLANSDYLAGLTRLTDAMLTFATIAIGVSLSFMLDGVLHGGVIELSGMTESPQTYSLWWQAVAGFVGTLAFAILFGIDREHYMPAGVIGALGWVAYLVMYRYAGTTPPVSAAVASAFLCLLARIAAIPFRSPAQVFIISGIIPLVPGAGIFWFTYYLTASQFDLSTQSGFMAIKVAVAIVLGIVLTMELPQRLFSRKRRTH